jgi:glutamate racemase
VAVAAAVAPLTGQDMDVVVLACTHFPLLAEELALALPGVGQVDGGPGIARRIAHLTAGQSWPVQPPPGIGLFTGVGPNVPLRGALARFKLTDIRHV